MASAASVSAERRARTPLPAPPPQGGREDGGEGALAAQADGLRRLRRLVCDADIGWTMRLSALRFPLFAGSESIKSRKESSRGGEQSSDANASRERLSAPSFRGARSANPESIVPAVQNFLRLPWLWIPALARNARSAGMTANGCVARTLCHSGTERRARSAAIRSDGDESVPAV